MKKQLEIGAFLLSVFGVIGVTAQSFSLVTEGANSGSFGISQAKIYYLKGSFNDWEANNDYILEDVTASMGEEENKISEYTITKPLSKDAELKIWDSFNNWYTQGNDNCSYVDKWGRSTLTDNNYVVPMTASYDIYLKFYSTGYSQIYITADDVTTLYFKPSSNWLSDGARFAAYFFNDEAETNTWLDMALDGGYYKVAIPSGYNDVIFCRMDGGTTENNWSNKWNQTANLHFDGYQSTYELPSDGWDDFDNSYWGSI